MELKRALNLLNNQYFKSFKRYEKSYYYMSDFDERVKEFNEGYLKLVSAVLSGDPDQIRANLFHSLFYIRATINEQDKLDFELLGII